MRVLPRTESEREEADKVVQSMSPMQSSDYEFLLRRPSAILETQFEVHVRKTVPYSDGHASLWPGGCKHLVEQPFQCRNSLATACLV